MLAELLFTYLHMSTYKDDWPLSFLFPYDHFLKIAFVYRGPIIHVIIFLVKRGLQQLAAMEQFIILIIIYLPFFPPHNILSQALAHCSRFPTAASRGSPTFCSSDVQIILSNLQQIKVWLVFIQLTA